MAADPPIAPNAPPSDYAIADLVNGVPGAVWRVAGLTLLRSLIIAPGLALMGMRGQKLVTSSLAASSTVSVSMALIYSVRKKNGTRDA
jgi:hypothetical protein